MSTSEFDETLEQLLQNDRPKYSPNQEQDNDHLTYDSDNDSDNDSIHSEDSTIKENLNIDTEIMSPITESIIDVVSVPDTEKTKTDTEIIRTPQPCDQWDERANELSKMDRYLKGEQQEKWIKDQLETYGFTVTKTQSRFDKEIIRDNGIDHLFQIKINNQII